MREVSSFAYWDVKWALGRLDCPQGGVGSPSAALTGLDAWCSSAFSNGLQSHWNIGPFLSTFSTGWCGLPRPPSSRVWPTQTLKWKLVNITPGLSTQKWDYMKKTCNMEYYWYDQNKNNWLIISFSQQQFY